MMMFSHFSFLDIYLALFSLGVVRMLLGDFLIVLREWGLSDSPSLSFVSGRVVGAWHVVLEVPASR